MSVVRIGPPGLDGAPLPETGTYTGDGISALKLYAITPKLYKSEKWPNKIFTVDYTEGQGANYNITAITDDATDVVPPPSMWTERNELQFETLTMEPIEGTEWIASGRPRDEEAWCESEKYPGYTFLVIRRTPMSYSNRLNITYIIIDTKRLQRL